MIKRIIFDMDDTLVMSSVSYGKCIKKLLEQENIPLTEQLVLDIDNSFSLYEKENDMYDEEKYINFFNEKYGYNFSRELMTKLNESFVVNANNELNPYVKEILEYLSGKYELVILTNYFYDVQRRRLEIMGIDKFFKELYCGDKVPCKPRKESYNIGRGSFLHSECLVIGDSLKNDYLAPKECGMSAILYDKDNKYKDSDYERISDFIELTKIL